MCSRKVQGGILTGAGMHSTVHSLVLRAQTLYFRGLCSTLTGSVPPRCGVHHGVRIPQHTVPRAIYTHSCSSEMGKQVFSPVAPLYSTTPSLSKATEKITTSAVCRTHSPLPSLMYRMACNTGAVPRSHHPPTSLAQGALHSSLILVSWPCSGNTNPRLIIKIPCLAYGEVMRYLTCSCPSALNKTRHPVRSSHRK